jgi:hypothetical protein
MILSRGRVVLVVAEVALVVVFRLLHKADNSVAVVVEVAACQMQTLTARPEKVAAVL